jgi:hypothetical protein
MFNAKTGRYDGISSAYRVKLTPAFVVDPDKAMAIPVRDGEARGKEGYDATMAAMIKGAETLVPQEVPPASHELAATDGIEIGRGGVPLRGRGERGYRRNRAADDKAKATPAPDLQ